MLRVMGNGMRRVRLRRFTAIAGAVLFGLACLSLYLMLERVKLDDSGAVDSVVRQMLDGQLVAKLQAMEDDLRANRKTIEQIKDTIRDIAKRSKHVDWPKLVSRLVGIAEEGGARRSNASSNWLEPGQGQLVVVPADTCGFAEKAPPKTDIQMLDVFNTLAFDNPDGGSWKQGFPITYNADKWKKEKLKVFVIPHSHCDPGWVKTFAKYYSDQVRHILNNMVQKLVAYPRMRFIYAEISFFSVWWAEIDEPKRAIVRKLLNESRLEIVTGGWVMSDEATAHYYSMLDQLIEGNQWLVNNVGVRPSSGWSIDPFGQSPTMAYLLGQSGFNNLLLQRVHYSIKKYFSKTQQLEFVWRQNWDSSGATDVFTHLMPFYSYDVPHTCGPDPRVCCQFDFRRLDGGSMSCPWKIPPTVITPQNVADRAALLLEQYRMKSELYRHSVLLVPLGDDFRYELASEWDQQYSNYIQLFDYMNSRQDWNIEVGFATLSDYYAALRARVGTQPSLAGAPKGLPVGYPSLAGDFFTYADRDDHYWSGYFTSRPFYKRLTRVLEHHLRGGEVLYSLALATSHRYASVSFREFGAPALMRRIVAARRYLGLFQHHDAVTGTAKDHVVIDYGEKLLESLTNMKRVMIDSAQFLLTADKSKYTYNENSVAFDVDEVRSSHDALPQRTVVHVSAEPRVVVFYNSIARNRTTVVRVHVSAPHLEVRDPTGRIVQSQVDPIWVGSSKEIETTSYRVSFLATVPPLGLSRYTIRSTEPNENNLNSFADCTLYNHGTAGTSTVGPFTVRTVMPQTGDSSVSIDNSILVASFSTRWGVLQSVRVKEEREEFKAELQWMRYGTPQAKDRSGAYLFIADGDAKPVEYASNPPIRVIAGRISSEFHVFIEFCEQVVRVDNSPGIDGQALDVYNLVDIRSRSNFELAMRLKTDIKHDYFFADLNGFQMQRRRTLSKLPQQGNYYPMTSAAYIEDNQYRMSILSAQSLGVACLQTGWLEVMQDRRLDQDDNRGVLQGVHDNKRTPNEFRILVEKRIANYRDPPLQPSGYLSLLGHMLSQELIYPIHVLPGSDAGKQFPGEPAPLTVYEPLTRELPCEVHMLTLRTLQRAPDLAGLLPSDQMALLFHRSAVDCAFVTLGATCPVGGSKIALTTLFSELSVQSVHRTTLSLAELSPNGGQGEAPGGGRDDSTDIEVPPMHIRAFVIELR